MFVKGERYLHCSCCFLEEIETSVPLRFSTWSSSITRFPIFSCGFFPFQFLRLIDLLDIYKERAEFDQNSTGISISSDNLNIVLQTTRLPDLKHGMQYNVQVSINRFNRFVCLIAVKSGSLTHFPPEMYTWMDVHCINGSKVTVVPYIWKIAIYSLMYRTLAFTSHGRLSSTRGRGTLLVTESVSSRYWEIRFSLWTTNRQIAI